MSDVKECLEDIHRLYRNRIQTLEVENAKYLDIATAAEANASNFKNKVRQIMLQLSQYEFLKQSTKRVLDVTQLEIANLMDEVKYSRKQDERKAEVTSDPTQQHLLKLREEQLKRLASELDILNGTLDTYKERIAMLEKREEVLTAENVSLLKELAEERRDRARLRRQINTDKKFRYPSLTLPLNNLLSKGSMDKTNVIDLLYVTHLPMSNQSGKMDPLPDPMHDRRVPEIEAPPQSYLPESVIFPKGLNQEPDWITLKDHLLREGRISKEMCLHIIRRVTAVTSCEPNLLQLNDPITVVGDIHGQFYDMTKLLEVGGNPLNGATQYLFLGDYVDRGSFAIEVVLTLFCLKLNYPNKIWLLRGNHECRQMTAFFNFRDECRHKYDMAVYTAFMDTFDTLPLAAVVNNRFFAVHGGLSPQLRKKDGVNSINRFQEPPRSGPFCDLLWSDPADDDKPAHQQHMNDLFFPNDVRGCSYFFGYNAAKCFLDDNKLLSIIRAHEAQLDGYKMHKPHPVNHFPTVITIFSAPNYCDVYSNKAAVLRFDNNTLNIQQFNFTAHPYHLPNFMDVFAWSIPFVSVKINEIINIVLNRPGGFDMEEESDDEDADPNAPLSSDLEAVLTLDETAIMDALRPHRATMSVEKAQTLRAKVNVISRFVRMLSVLRDSKDDVVSLKALNDGRLPGGVVLSGPEGIKNGKILDPNTAFLAIQRLQGPSAAA